ncbi:MAG: glycosyltransferase family 4 protein [Lachnospiraceae bacterium]|nr:glycosyltransferase family 4 protein [Lachnospiraceae bacterium]
MKILIIRTFPSILDPNGYNIQEIGFAKALVRAGVNCDVVLYNGNAGNEEREIEVGVSDAGQVARAGMDISENTTGPTVGGDKKTAAGPATGTEKNNITSAKVHVYMRHGFGILKNGFFPGLKKIAKQYDLLQVHEYDQISSWRFYAWYKDKPVVIYHGPYYDDYNKGYNLKCKVFDTLFLHIKHNRDTLCFTKSKAAAGFLKTKGFKNAVPIGVGLDTENFGSITADASETTDSDTFNLLYVGKIEPRRNSYLLLDILSRAVEIARENKIHLTIVGDGEPAYVDDWMKKAHPLIDAGHLTYIKKKTQSELKQMYGQMNLMVFPSNYEIFGMVLLEAMYFNLPVISSDNGGSDTLISDGEDGVIVKNFDADIWAKRIVELAENKEEYQTIKDNLTAKDHSIYTWDGIAKRYLSELKKHDII